MLAAGGKPETITANITSLTLAQIRYLQEEYTNLLVSHQFDEGTAKLFPTLQQNPAAFTATALDKEGGQKAVAITGARQTCPGFMGREPPVVRGSEGRPRLANVVSMPLEWQAVGASGCLRLAAL